MTVGANGTSTVAVDLSVNQSIGDTDSGHPDRVRVRVGRVGVHSDRLAENEALNIGALNKDVVHVASHVRAGTGDKVGRSNG